MVFSPTFSEKEKLKTLLHNSFRFSTAKLVIFCCLVAAFLIRFLLLPQNEVISPDGFFYATLGEKMVSGDIYGGISAYWSPLYSFSIGVTSLFFQDSEFSGRFVSVIAGTLLVIPVYLLICKIYGRLSGYIAAALVVIHPTLIESSGWILTESIYTLIFTILILVGWQALWKGKTSNFFYTGILLGAAYLVKPEAIGFVGLFFVLTIGVKLFRSNMTIKKLLIKYSYLVLGFAILFLPYFGFIHQKTGQWTISTKLQNNTFYTKDHIEELKLINSGETTIKDQSLGDFYDNVRLTNDLTVIDQTQANINVTGFSEIKRNATRILRFLDREVREFIPRLFPFYHLFALFAAIGFFYKPWKRLRLAKELYLFFILIAFLIGYAAAVVELRYLIPIIPILIGWVAYGIVRFSDWTTKSALSIFKSERRFIAIFVQFCAVSVIAVLFLVPTFKSLLSKDSGNQMPVEKSAGVWIKSQTQSQPLIMASLPRVAYYAGGKHIYLPDEEFSVVLDYARRKKVNYIIYDQRLVDRTPRAFPPDGQTLPRDIRLVQQFSQNDRKPIHIYELVK